MECPKCKKEVNTKLQQFNEEITDEICEHCGEVLFEHSGYSLS